MWHYVIDLAVLFLCYCNYEQVTEIFTALSGYFSSWLNVTLISVSESTLLNKTNTIQDLSATSKEYLCIDALYL